MLLELGYVDMDWLHMALDRGPRSRFCEHGKEDAVSLQGKEFLD
jgi:hypothetical protein